MLIFSFLSQSIHMSLAISFRERTGGEHKEQEEDIRRKRLKQKKMTMRISGLIEVHNI